MTIEFYNRERLRAICVRYGIAKLEIFGSVARGVENDDSDIDLLYTLEAGARLGWEIEDLSDELSEIFGRKVDLLARSAIHARLRDQVLREAEAIYAAA
ncbi:MAG: nucleotidyltransferase family protein [Arachnia sp.]